MKLLEGLDYHAMIGQVDPKISVDEYAAKMGKDSDIVTIAFKMNSKLAAQDLVGWLEKGYSFILDASVSEGEISPGKYLVFAEMNRRTSVPERIVEVLTDMQTLTDIPITEWTVSVDDEDYDADEEMLKQVIVLSPLEYKKTKEREEELNEYRELSGLPTTKMYVEDEYIKNLKAMAGM
jgi:hypothetical protein